MQFNMTMNTKAFCVLLGSALAASAATERITLTLTVTNLPVTGDTLTINAAARYWTNSSSATTFETNTTTLNSATNLWNSIVATPYSGNLIPGWVSATSIVLRAQIGGALVASEVGGWASLVLSTQSVQRAYPVTVPLGNQLTASQATNIASQLVSDLSAMSTNTIATNSAGWSTYVPTNGTFWGHIVASPSIAGTFGNVANGYWTNGILDNPTSTNLVNYGNAISSPGSASASEQFGTGATATGANSLAVGDTASATAASSIAIGSDATVSGPNSIGIGDAPVVGGGLNIVIGNGSEAGGTNCIIIGHGIELTGTNSFAIGRSISSTVTNGGIIGGASQNIIVPGVLNPAIITNTTHKGTNQFNGSVAYTRNAVTSIAAGNNRMEPGLDKTYLNLTGTPGAAFTIASITNGWDGRRLLIENSTGYQVTVAHESGWDSTVGNRILTSTGADVVLTNRDIIRLIYNSGTNRWILDRDAPPANSSGAYGALMLSTNRAFNLAVQSTYYVVSNYNAKTLGGNFTSDQVNGILTNTLAGDYQISISMSFDGANVALDKYECALFTNGVECTLIEWKQDAGSADSESASDTGIISLPAASWLDMRIQNTEDTGSITVLRASLTAHKL